MRSNALSCWKGILTPLTASTNELFPAINAFSRWNCTELTSSTHTIGRQWPQAEENPVWDWRLYCKSKTVQTKWMLEWGHNETYSRLLISSRNSSMILERMAYSVDARWLAAWVENELPVAAVPVPVALDFLLMVPVRRILDIMFENGWEWFVEWLVLAGCGFKVTCTRASVLR